MIVCDLWSEIVALICMIRLPSLCTYLTIEQAPIGDYGYNEMDGGVDAHSGEEDEVEEIGEGMFDQAQAKVRVRSKNYTH